MSDRERRISDLAYRIWEESGQPEGQDDRHWSEAERRYAAEQAGDAAPAKRPKAGAKAGAKSGAKAVKPAKGGKTAKPVTSDKAAKAMAEAVSANPKEKLKDKPLATKPKSAASKAAADAPPVVAKARKPKVDAGKSTAEPPKAKGRGKAKG